MKTCNLILVAGVGYLLWRVLVDQKARRTPEVETTQIIPPGLGREMAACADCSGRPTAMTT